MSIGVGTRRRQLLDFEAHVGRQQLSLGRHRGGQRRAFADLKNAGPILPVGLLNRSGDPRMRHKGYGNKVKIR